MPTMQHHLPHDTELVIDGRKAQWAVRAMTRCLAGYAVILGIAILYGGRERFSGVSYEDALQAPGAPGSWGVLLLLAGVTAWAGTVLARPILTAAGMYLGACWCAFFAITFAESALDHHAGSNTAPITYFALALLFSTAAGVHRARGMREAPHADPAVVGLRPATSRHVLIVGFLLPLCIVSGISILLQATPPPGSIEALVPHEGVIAWACVLAGGAALYLFAVWSQPKHPVSGVLMEQVASVSLGVAAIFYAGAALTFGGWPALLPAGVLLTLGVTCAYRWFELQRWVRRAKRAAQSAPK